MNLPIGFTFDGNVGNPNLNIQRRARYRKETVTQIDDSVK